MGGSRLRPRGLIDVDLGHGEVALPLTRGFVAILDAEDGRLAAQYNWYTQIHGRTHYAVRTVCEGGETRTVMLHRFLMGDPPDGEVDHKDGNGLHNTRINLRVVTRPQNTLNRARCKKNTSGVKGVSWRPHRGKWVARISKGGKRLNLGGFDSLGEAAAAYANASSKLHGEFARSSQWA